MMTTQILDDDDLRARIVEELAQSLAMSREMMMNQKLEPKMRERWTQINTNTAQVLNQILKDKQLREWEKRLKELEASGRVSLKLPK